MIDNNYKAGQVLADIKKFEEVEQTIKSYLLPKLYTLYNEKKLNKGRLPLGLTAEKSVSIESFGVDDGKIHVYIQISWHGYNYDEDYLDLTCEEWDAIPSVR